MIDGIREKAVLAGMIVIWLAMMPIYLHLPVYTDEIVWKVLQGRFVVDEMKVMTALAAPSCGDYVFDMPQPLLPFLALDSMLYFGASPMWIRVTGIVIYSVWMVGCIGLIASVAHFKGLRTWLLLLLLAALTLGVAPFLVILNRPEKMLLLVLTSMFAIALMASQSAERRYGLWKDALLFTLGIWSLSIHPKALFFVPFGLVCFFAASNSRRTAVLASAGFLVVAAWAYESWSARLDCPGDAHFAKMLTSRNAVEILKAGEFVTYLKHVWWEFHINPLSFTYLPPIFFKRSYTSNWLPHVDQLTALQITANLVLAISIALILVILGFCLMRYIQMRRWRAFASMEFMLTIMLLLSLVATSALQIHKNDYDSSLAFPVMILAMMGAIAALLRADPGLVLRPRFRRYSQFAILGVVAGAVTSQMAVAERFAPHAFGDWSRPGYLDGQPFSVSSATTSAVNVDVIEAARACQIEPNEDAQRIVVDDLTYAAFASTSEPYFITYLVGGWSRGIADLNSFLKDKGSDGMIVGCHYMPPQFRSVARQTGPYCCLEAFK